MYQGSLDLASLALLSKHAQHSPSLLFLPPNAPAHHDSQQPRVQHFSGIRGRLGSAATELLGARRHYTQIHVKEASLHAATADLKYHGKNRLLTTAAAATNGRFSVCCTITGIANKCYEG